MVRHNLKTTVGHVLEGMPKLRSGLSRDVDGKSEWKQTIEIAMTFVSEMETSLPDKEQEEFAELAADCLRTFRGLDVPAREAHGIGIADDCPDDLRELAG
jgi:DNA (cytosine-5)-methyltransferase 1